MGFFFKVSERWTQEPLPSEEILEEEEREVAIGDRIEMRMFYRVKKVALDMDKLLDPEYSHRVKKFTDSPKGGLGVELYSAVDAQTKVGQHHKLFTEVVEHTGKDGEPLLPVEQLIAALRQADQEIDDA